MASASIARADPLSSLRIAGRLAAILAVLLIALLMHGSWRLVRLPSPWPRFFLGSFAWIAGARRQVLATPLRRDVFLIANHQSWLDVLLLAGVTGSAFVAKGELKRVPVIAWLCGLNRTLFVDRGDRLGIADQIAELRAALSEGYPITIFPEGTTGDGTALLPFKPALLAVLDPPPSGVRVQPVLIDYGEARGEVAWVGDEPGQQNVLRLLGRAGTIRVTLTFLEPFDPAAHPGRKAITAEARQRMADALWAPAS
jgi:1-acyl-sn-glycerol-3-phosphate acyltransferase